MSDIHEFASRVAENLGANAEANADDCLPQGFKITRAGIYWARKGAGGNEQWHWLCSPVRVIALPRGPNGKGWGRLIEIEDPDGNLHRWSMPAELLAGDGIELRRECMRLGLRLSPNYGARSAFSALLQQWEPNARVVTTDRLGWSDEACKTFVLGSGRVIGDSDVVFQSDHAPGIAAEMHDAGTLDEWRATVGAACTGNPLMIVAVSLAFSGVLLEPLGIDGGGVHLRGASSRGKSTVQRVAASVWGSPRFMNSWRATANGLEGIAATCNGSLLVLDELAEVSGRDAGQAVYMLAIGTGKARAHRSGVVREQLRWRVAILSSGEITLADKLVEVGGRAAAGQAVRLLDIEADNGAFGAFENLHGLPSGAAFADRLREATAKNFGTAGPTFVAGFLRRRDEMLAQLRAEMDSFRMMAVERFRLSGEGQVERAVMRLALMAAAGELGAVFGITDWAPGIARDAALDVLGVWLESRGGGDIAAEAQDAITRTRAFLVAHGDARFERLGTAPDSRSINNRAGWRDPGMFYIATDTWREIHKGSDPKAAARHVRDADFLKPGDGKNLAMRLSRGLKGRPRVYAVSEDILGADGD